MTAVQNINHYPNKFVPPSRNNGVIRWVLVALQVGLMEQGLLPGHSILFVPIHQCCHFPSCLRFSPGALEIVLAINCRQSFGLQIENEFGRRLWVGCNKGNLMFSVMVSDICCCFATSFVALL